MIKQHSIEEVLAIDIVDVIGKYITLQKKGANYQGRCPFHHEKTPSFSVSASKGLFKCFGCGKAGNAVGFVMDLKKLDFISAIRAIASDHNITLEQESLSKEDKEKFDHRESLLSANKIVHAWFVENLFRKEHQKAMLYVRSRWNDETIGEFGIGYAPDGWDGLKSWAKEKGIRQEVLIEAGLLAESKGRVYDYFRGRIIIPIPDPGGRIVGFTGRDLTGGENVPKYLNTRETEIFNKGRILFGFHSAYRSIKESGSAILVEGHADVVKLHQVGRNNAIGSGGTALTRDQVALLKRYANSVTIIGDSDKPGQAAVAKNARLIIEAGLYCNVIPLPESDQKQDPDSFFTDGEQFTAYADKNTFEFIIWQAGLNKSKCDRPEMKSKIVDDLAYLISRLPESSHGIYIEQLSRIIKPKKAWEDRLRQILSDLAKPESKEDPYSLPSGVDVAAYEKYGFYSYNRMYFFRSKDGQARRATNFIMEPLFHIASVLNSKRLYRITNEFSFTQVIELQQKDLISISNFKLRIESLGNFLFEGTEPDLNKLKRYWYEKTESCSEITQLGWQKDGFWAWSNGIFNSAFKSTDHNGIVRHDEKNYYLPSLSDIYKSEDNLFVSERRFRFFPGKISLYDYAQRLVKVYGENAIFGLCFYFATLFRDHIAGRFGFFPILNLFGPKGAGKTEMAISLLQFFGNHTKGPNITNTTRAALADHVALFANALCHIDEFKNSIEIEKVEFLKGLWDGTGRTRMNMDKDKKKETTNVDVGIILTGQEMTTIDIALYSRLIFLSFHKDEYTDQEKAAFNDLKEIEKLGLTHITQEILSHRKLFLADYMENYRLAGEELTGVLKGSVIEDRIFRNWLVIIAAYRTLKEVVRLPWLYDEVLAVAARLLIRQNKETKKSNELAIFWGIVEFLTNDGLIKEEVDFKVDYVSRLKTDKVNGEAEWNPPKNVLLLNHSRIFHLYKIHGQRSKENVLPMKTLEYYLMNSKEYLGRKNSVSFKVEENKKIVEDKEEPVMGAPPVKTIKRRITTAMVFDYDLLNISILNASKSDEEDDGEQELPF